MKEEDRGNCNTRDPREEHGQGSKAIQAGKTEGPENSTGGEHQQGEAENSTQHRPVNRNSISREELPPPKEKEEVRNTGNERSGDGMTRRTTPGMVRGPRSLTVHAGGPSATDGKVSGHRRREAMMTCSPPDSLHSLRRSVRRFWHSRGKWGCRSRTRRKGRATGTSTRRPRNSRNQII